MTSLCMIDIHVFADSVVGKYFGIQGQVLRIKGLKGNTSNLYCKVRFDKWVLNLHDIYSRIPLYGLQQEILYPIICLIYEYSSK